MVDLDENEKEEKGFFNNFFSKEKKRLDISARAIIDNLVFSKKDVTAYYRMTPRMFDFLSTDLQISDAAKTSASFTNLIENRTDPLELHIITTTNPLDVEAWHAQVEAVSSSWDPPRTFNAFIDEMATYLEGQGFSNRVAYVGVNLGRRGAINWSDMNPLTAGFRGAWEALRSWVLNTGRSFDQDVSAAEERQFRSKEEHYYNIFTSSNLASSKVSAQELLLLIKRQLYPTMPVPDLDVDHENRLGAGDLALETSGVITNKFRWLEINQLIGSHEIVGYRAALSLTKFPRNGSFPFSAVPFLYLPQFALGLPFTTYSRVKLLPNAKMRKEIEKKRKETADQMKNMGASAQNAVDSTLEDNSKLNAELSDLKDMDAMTNFDKSPWVEGNYRIIIEAISEKAMREVTSVIRQKYSELDIHSVLSSGDQLELFLEQMPGDRTRINSFRQLTNINHLSTSGFNISSNVGDPLWSGSKTGR